MALCAKSDQNTCSGECAAEVIGSCVEGATFSDYNDALDLGTCAD